MDRAGSTAQYASVWSVHRAHQPECATELPSFFARTLSTIMILPFCGVAFALAHTRTQIQTATETLAKDFVQDSGAKDGNVAKVCGNE